LTKVGRLSVSRHASPRWHAGLVIDAALVAAWGSHAFIKRNILAKLVANYSFEDWKFEASIALVLTYYIGVTS